MCELNSQIPIVRNWYVSKSISELQIQVAPYVFELIVGNYHR